MTGLPNIRNQSGWVREPQRFPVRLVFEGDPPRGIRYGAQVNGGGAPSWFSSSLIVPMLGILQKDLGQSITAILANGIVAGLLLTWAAHAAFPDPGELPPRLRRRDRAKARCAGQRAMRRSCSSWCATA